VSIIQSSVYFGAVYLGFFVPNDSSRAKSVSFGTEEPWATAPKEHKLLNAAISKLAALTDSDRPHRYVSPRRAFGRAKSRVLAATSPL
jgi:hypothetical protein